MSKKNKSGKRVSGDPRISKKRDLSYKGPDVSLIENKKKKEIKKEDLVVYTILDRMGKEFNKNLIEYYENSPEWKKQSVREMIMLRIGICSLSDDFFTPIYDFLVFDRVIVSEYCGILNSIRSDSLKAAIKKFEEKNKGCHVYHVVTCLSFLFPGEEDWSFLFVSENDYESFPPGKTEQGLSYKFSYNTGNVPRFTDEFGTVCFNHCCGGLVRVC